ncbi:hypothetical protein MJO28_002886 [Puccinia striiformis f. sp. tritici]|uniref:Uncharacterized protein n=1 Tax=Puccinia striiformis f. sp. tritici TaxID=168172 RepID=A0ACC0ER66_9BASI|nr:hypothetical protein MJO28_002886 [Puccinia striiformis f. sp. tritici]
MLVGIKTKLIKQSSTFDQHNRNSARYQDTLDHLVGSVCHVNQIPIDFKHQTLIIRCWIMHVDQSQWIPAQGHWTLNSVFYSALILISKRNPRYRLKWKERSGLRLGLKQKSEVFTLSKSTNPECKACYIITPLSVVLFSLKSNSPKACFLIS